MLFIFTKEKSTISVSVIKVYIKGKGWISKEPKEPARTRIISLSQSANKLLVDLRKKYPSNKYIFSDNINFNSYLDWLKRWQISNNISPVLSVHELRHTHATLLLSSGVPIKYISKRLGHSNTFITENTYIEYLKEEDSEVANIVDTI